MEGLIKICKICDETKPIELFSKCKKSQDGYKTICKKCHNKKQVQYDREHPEKKKLQQKIYREKTRVIANIKRKEWNKRTGYRKTPAQKEKHREYKQRLYVKEKMSQYNKDYWKKRWEKVKASRPPVIPLTEKEIEDKDINLRLKRRLILQVKKGLKRQDATKQYKSIELIGCSYAELMKYLESKFKEGMTWENRGYYGWHIDHIKPLSLFNLQDKEQQKRAFCYTNLQPLWWYDNLAKGAKYVA